MRLVILSTLLALVSAAVAGAATAPRVRLAAMTPTAVRGTGFFAHERVVITIRGGNTRLSVATSSSATGAFTARFRRTVPAGCDGLAVTAVGARGDRAAWKSPPKPCGAQLAP